MSLVPLVKSKTNVVQMENVIASNVYYLVNIQRIVQANTHVFMEHVTFYQALRVRLIKIAVPKVHVMTVSVCSNVLRIRIVMHLKSVKKDTVT